MLVQLVEAEGLVAEVVSDGGAALESLYRQAPDIVVLRAGIPVLNGFDVCRRIRAHAATRLTPVVLLTRLGGQEHRIAGINAGADDVMATPADPEELKARVRALLRRKRYTSELDSAESIIISLALAVETRDPYTSGHCERLAGYATAVGSALELREDDLATLRRAGYLHDVGKIGIPDAILFKAGPLTADEYTLMKRHPLMGETLCGRFQSLAAVRPIVRHHHERLDGSGYPDGLRGAEIPLLTRIITIVDTFDALTTRRTYREAMSSAFAYKTLRDGALAGWWDRTLVETFIELHASWFRQGHSMAPVLAHVPRPRRNLSEQSPVLKMERCDEFQVR